MLQFFLRTLLWPYPLKRQTLSSTSGHAVLGSLSVFASETQLEKRDIHCESPSMIQMTSYMGSTRATLRTAVPYHQMRFNTTAYFKHGAIICLQRRRIRPIVACVPYQGWQDVSGLYDTLPKIDSKLWVPGPRWHFSALVLSAWQKSREGHPICNMANVTHEARKVTRECQSAQFVSGQIWSAKNLWSFRKTAQSKT